MNAIGEGVRKVKVILIEEQNNPLKYLRIKVSYRLRATEARNVSADIAIY